MTPLSNKIQPLVSSPLTARYWQTRVIITHFLERSTRGGKDVGLVAEVLNHSLASFVDNCDDVERPAALFAAVKPELCKIHVTSELVQGAFTDAHAVVVVVAYSSVTILDERVIRRINRSVLVDQIGNKKPAT